MFVEILRGCRELGGRILVCEFVGTTWRAARKHARGYSPAICGHQGLGAGPDKTVDGEGPRARIPGRKLAEKHPDTDPLTVRFTDLLQWIVALPGFTGDPLKSNEAKLEAVQMAWHEEYKENHS